MKRLPEHIYGSELLDGVKIHQEAEIVTMIEDIVAGVSADWHVIPSLNDLITARQYARATGETVHPFRNPILACYEDNRNEEKLWDCFEKAYRAYNAI